MNLLFLKIDESKSLKVSLIIKLDRRDLRSRNVAIEREDLKIADEA